MEKKKKMENNISMLNFLKNEWTNFKTVLFVQIRIDEKMNVSLNFMLTLSRFKRFKKTQQLKFSKQQLPDPGFGQILRFQDDSGYFEVSCHIKQGFGEKGKKYVNMQYVCVHQCKIDTSTGLCLGSFRE